MQDKRRKVFVSYSHNDADWLKRLQVHLKDLERRGLIDLWDDTKIQAGAQWRVEIRTALDSASVAVLLISADFIASDFIADNELPPLLAAAEKDGVTILPLILKPSRFEKIESLSRFQSVNPPSRPLIGLPEVEQERYLVKLSDDVLRAVEEAEKKAAERAELENLRVFKLPFPRNTFFTGRDDILENLHTNFNDAEPVQALSGLGGMGKTQTALEYAYRYQDDYKFVFWVRAQSRETIVADFAAFAALLKLPEANLEDQNYAVSAVKRWLEGNRDWLLILDNADDWPIVRDFIPFTVTGHILLTTQERNTRPLAARQAIEKMEPPEGALYLLRRIGKLKKDEPLEAASEELRKQAEALSRAVDGLPLALDQAAAFIDETPSSLEEYLQFYQSEGAKLLAQRGESGDDHKDPVTVTFSLAFKKVAEANQAAAGLLRLCAFLEADAIPEEIFGGSVKELGRVLNDALVKPLGLVNVIKEAGRFSLLRRDPDIRTVSLHRLVQAVIKDEMDKPIQRLWAERAVRVVSRVFPDAEDVNNWPLCGRLIPHAQALARLIDEFGFEFPKASTVVQEAGIYFWKRAQYAEAEPLCQYTLTLKEKTLGPHHPHVVRSLSVLGGLYKAQGKYAEAKLLHKRALTISEKTHGLKHPDVATSLDNLALLYQDQGKYAEAEPLHNRALDIREKTLGPKHPDVATSLDSLGLLYYHQGKNVEAEPLHNRALNIRENALGSEHPHVAPSLNNLALSCYEQRKYAEAERLSQRSLVLTEKAFGPEHPDVARILNTLAKVYHKQRKYSEAEVLLIRAQAIQEKVLGPEHPDVAHSLHNLANLYADQEKDAEAEPLFQRALAIREKMLGLKHPDVATALEDYASLLRKFGKEAEAVELEARTSTIRDKASSAQPAEAEQIEQN